MNQSGNSIIKNIKINNSDKKYNKQKHSLNKNKSLSSKNVYPHDTTFTAKYNFNNNTKEDMVIASIIRTSTINNETYHNPEKNKLNSQIKFSKKNATLSIIDNDYNEIGDFSFINIDEKIKPFIYKPQKAQDYTSHAFNNFHFLDIVSSYRMIIIILIDDDSLYSSDNLSKIFESIILSLNSLAEINISYKDFLVCIFFQHFSFEENFKEIFPGLSYYNCIKSNLIIHNFCCSYGNVLSVNDTPINSLLFYKENSTFIEIYKFFYSYILNDLISLLNIDPKEIGKTFLLVNWPNGKIYEKSSNKYHKSRILAEIFRICNNRNMILIPDIIYTPYKRKDYFGYLHKYNFDSDKIYVNLIWDMMCGYPIDHRFFFINMNYKLYLIMKDYYQNNLISIYSNEYYQDYNLIIYLKKQIENIPVKKIQLVTIEYNNLPSNLITFFCDFHLKRGSEYANFFVLISYFFSCKNMDFTIIFKKIVLFFKLISSLIEFFWLGISLLISYSVFNETFSGYDNNIDYFCSFGYAIIVIVLLFISTIFIKNRPLIKNNKIERNLEIAQDSYCIIIILYIVHYAYNIFFLVCSIIAIYHLDEGKYQEETNFNFYKFKKKYFIILLILNILFFLLPSFIRPSNLISRGFFYYLILQFFNSTCFFHIPYLFICIRNIDSSKKNIESIYIIIYILLNGLLTIMCLIFDKKRQRRMDFFYILSSILLILSGIKFLVLIIANCWHNRFNRKIATGQLPHYNIENIGKSEYERNLNDINFNINNSLAITKNESILPIKNNDEKPNYNENNNNPFLKNRTGLEKQFSSQINNNKNLLLAHSFELDNILDVRKSHKSNKINRNNYPFLQFDEIENHIDNNIKKDLNNEFENSNKSSYIITQKKDGKSEESYHSNKIENDNFNKNDFVGINYPFDSQYSNENKYNNDYNISYNENYNDNYNNYYDYNNNNYNDNNYNDINYNDNYKNYYNYNNNNYSNNNCNNNNYNDSYDNYYDYNKTYIAKIVNQSNTSSQNNT